MKLNILLIFYSFIFSNLSFADQKLDRNQFQTTIGGNQQKLSIRHKMIVQNRDYKAEFIVYNRNNKEKYFANIFVIKNNWGDVFFPKDFRKTDGSKVKVFPNGGDFIWNCIVEGEIVLNGSFTTSMHLFDVNVDLRKY